MKTFKEIALETVDTTHIIPFGQMLIENDDGEDVIGDGASDRATVIMNSGDKSDALPQTMDQKYRNTAGSPKTPATFKDKFFNLNRQVNMPNTPFNLGTFELQNKKYYFINVFGQFRNKDEE